MQTSLEPSTATASDAELLARFAASGDDPAFAELVRRHLPLVLAVTRRRLGGSGLAEDAAQQVFIALSTQARKRRGIPCLPAWLQKAAVYEAANISRRESRHHRRNLEAESLRQGRDPAGGGPQLDAALAALPERDRQVLLLHHFEKLPYDRVAARLGISAEAAQRRGHRALEKLRALLARRGVACDGETCAVWLGAALAPAAFEISPGFIARTTAMKKAASSSLPWLPLAAAVVLGGGTWAALTATRKQAPPPSAPPLAATSPRERPAVARKRGPSMPDSKLSPELLEFIALAKTDSKAAWEWVKDREDWNMFLQKAVPVLAERDLPAAERLLEVLDGRPPRVETITAIFDSRVDSNFESAISWVDSFTEPFERKSVQSSRNEYRSTERLDHDYAGALKIARSPEVRRWLIQQACEKYAATDEAAIERLGRQLEGEDRRVALGWTISLLLQRGDPRAYELLEEVKPGDSLLPEIRQAACRDPQALLEWIMAQTDKQPRYQLKASLWHAWCRRDAEAAAAWALGQNPKSDDIARKFTPGSDATMKRLMTRP
ncbi:RNA polymerase sigma factor [Luteolibacter sp. Populi]|uniref:RNA polymerase sigma factor n=1 Tax=Luteolibacter sp. Populi TaxID=3230487 RepID=UPI0034652667